MNEKWERHLSERVTELERDLAKMRRRFVGQRQRAELWKHRALLKERKR